MEHPYLGAFLAGSACGAAAVIALALWLHARKQRRTAGDNDSAGA